MKLFQYCLNLCLGVGFDDLLYGDFELGNGALELSSEAVEDVVGDLDSVAVQDVGDGDGRVDGDASTLAVSNAIGNSHLVLVGHVGDGN